MGKGKRSAEALDDSEAMECAGKSILELIKDRLDEYIDELMDPDAMENMKGKEVRSLKDRAAGVTEAIAIIERPYLPDEDVVRAEAMDRWEERNG